MNSEGSPRSRHLLALVELGGYPDFSNLYRSLGYQVTVEYSMRRALSLIKKQPPHIVVAEFNYQTAFRDRISNLESLMAAVQRAGNTKVIVLYEPELEHQFERLNTRFEFLGALKFPVSESLLQTLIASVGPDERLSLR